MLVDGPAGGDKRGKKMTSDDYKKTAKTYRELGKGHIENAVSINLEFLPELVKDCLKAGGYWMRVVLAGAIQKNVEAGLR